MKKALAKRILVVLLLALPTCAHAQAWPAKPVRVLVPFAPGGVTDAVARITAEWLTQRLGQPFVVENRPGATGAIAVDALVRSEPDGYTLLTASTPQLAIVPYVQKVAYDPLRDFAPVSIVGTNPFALGCNDKVPAANLKEFVAYWKANPDKLLTYGSPGQGSVGQLTMALFLARARVKGEAVLYKGGGPAVADVVAGHVPCYFGNFNEIIPHAGAGGRLRILAVSSAERARQLPEVPTVAEQGYPGFKTFTINGYVAPAATPRAIVERIAREIGAGCKDAAFAGRLEKIGVDPVCSTPAAFSEAIKEELAVWKEAVALAGMKAQ